jgi:hypothetical protein
MVYGANGAAHLEIDLAGDGRFTPVAEPATTRARR